MNRLGYEIQDDFDSLMWGDEGEEGGGVEMTHGGGRGSAFMSEEGGDGTMSAIRI